MSLTTNTPATAPAAVPAAAQAPSRSRLARTRRWTGRALAAVGLVALTGTAVGAVADFRSFDRTSGGYEAPYTGWTGTPIDWTDGGVTRTGFYKAGAVLDTALDCTTGMVTFHAFGGSYDWRPVSERAIAIHKPREACAAAGFTPRF